MDLARPLMVGMLVAMPALINGPMYSVAITTHVTAVGFVAVTTGSGTSQISAFRLDGSNERHLTTGPANHHYPSLSPDGTQLLYTGDEGNREEVYKLNLSGFEVVNG